MKLYRKIFQRKKIKSLGLLVIFLIIPFILSTPLFTFNNIQENDEKDTINKINLNPKLSGPPNENYFRYYKVITIDNTKVSGTGSHSNFPVLISLFDSDLRIDVQSDGDDIAFNDGTTWLDHEIEVFNQIYNNTHAQLVAWVRIPNLSTSWDTIIYMYYGNFTMGSRQNPTGVWDVNYMGVWHLSEDPSGTVYDSTSNNIDLTDVGTMTSGDLVDFKIGKGIDFDGNDDALQSTSSLTIESFSMELWCEADIQESQWKTPLSVGDYSDRTMSYMDSHLNWWDINDNDWRFSADLTMTDTHHFVMTYNDSASSTRLRSIVDGSLTAYNQNPNYPSITERVRGIGAGIDDAIWYDNFDGQIDEVRISNIARSTEWYSTQFNNQNDLDSFYSVSSANRVVAPSFSDFKYFKEITIDKTKVSGTGSYANFPVLISLFDSDLRIDVQPDGDDIAFTDGDITWLNHEIEVFNQTYNNTHAHLVAWVRIPSLSTSVDTIIYMYYGNSTMEAQEYPTGVWDSNYLGVWHLKDLTTSTIEGSTTNGNTGTKIAANQPLESNARIGKGQDFSGATDKIDIGTAAGEFDADKGMVETWIYRDFDDATATDNYVFQLRQDGNNRIYIVYDVGTDLWEFHYVGNSVDRLITLAPSKIPRYTWTYVVSTWDNNADEFKVYVNDGLENTLNGLSNWVSPKTPSKMYLGEKDGFDKYFDGKLDEVQISSIARSAGWILTEYNNQYDPDSFYSISSPYRVFSPSFNDFKYFKEITIDHTKVNGSGSHTNFPVLINITDSDLHNGADVQSNGNDIAFTDFNTWLDHEIELFDQTYNGTHAHLVAWVRIPSLSTSEDTIIRMYYGNLTMEAQEWIPRRVWDSNYMGVWHLSEVSGGSLAIKDSTINANDGTDQGSIDLGTEGQIGGAIGIDSQGEYIKIPDSSSLDRPSSAITISAWTNADYSDSHNMPVVAKDTAQGSPYAIWYMNSSNEVRYTLGGVTEVTSDVTVTRQGWMHLTLTYDGSEVRIYKDGSLAYFSSQTGTIVPNNFDLQFGQEEQWQDWFPGFLDEIRISDSVRSADWIATEYNNQNDPDSFYSIGINHPSNADDFNYYKEIVIDHTKIPGLSYHTNFPVSINLTDLDLRNDVQSDGDDIAFSKSNKWLDHEIELFNQTYSLTHAHLVAWVRIPKLSTSIDTIIRMYYGNPTMSSQENSTGVWDANYMGVWHLSESSGFTQDSTSYGEAGTVLGVTQGIDGQIDGAYDFNLDERIVVGDPSDGHLDFGTDSFTISCWLNVDQSTGTGQIPVGKGGTSTGTTGYSLVTSPNGQLIWPVISDGVGNQVKNEYSILFDTWTYSVTVVDRNKDLIISFKSGSQVDSDDISSVGSISNSYSMLFSDSTYDFDGLLDEVRISNVIRSADWILTQYNNQYDPDNFYSIGAEQTLNKTMYSQLQVNALDLYGNLIPNVNISMYNQTKLIKSDIANANGSVLFTDISQIEYNFTVTMESNILPNFTITVNDTSNAILINETFQILNLICNVSRNIFYIEDIDGVPLDSGWVIVGNSSDDLQNCTIDGSGKATFRWLNTTGYNYTVWYRDDNYNPKEITLASGAILTQNSQIDLTVNLTTVNFTILTHAFPYSPISGAKLILRKYNTSGVSIVNLTTDLNGKSTLRWLNSSGINGNYSLQIEFFGDYLYFNKTDGGLAIVTDIDLTIKAKDTLEFRTDVLLEEYATAIVSLTPADYIEIDWSSQLKLMSLFNVTKATLAPELLGPNYADSMLYQVSLAGNPIKSGTMPIDAGNVGKHYAYIDTDDLESDAIYIITISAQKSGFTIPSDLIIILNILENELILNQSQNDDSATTVNWLEGVDMSVKAYGKNTESFTIEDNIVQSEGHLFNLSIPDLSTDWNLSRIVFDVYNITFGVGVAEGDINLTITDDYGKTYIFTSGNSSYYYFNSSSPTGSWSNLEIDLNKRSLTENNTFKFIFTGTFVGNIDVISKIYLIRDKINVHYTKFNVTDAISIFAAPEGWAIKNITLEIYNYYNTTTWNKVSLSDLTSLNITTNEGFKKSLDQGYSNGTGLLTIDDRIIYPLDDQFLFTIEHKPNIVFDVNITVEYVQEFYKNQYLETYNFSITQPNISNGGNLKVSASEKNWVEEYSTLSITGIYNGATYFLPSELAMNITIGGSKFSISDTLFGGTFSLGSLNTNRIYTAKIETTQPVNFTISFMLGYSRIITYEIKGIVTYHIKENPAISGTVLYSEVLGYYLQTIDTFLVDVGQYTVRFTFAKTHYLPTIKDFELIVLNRETFLNGSTDYFRVFDEIYALEAVTFTFSYVDSQAANQPITNLQQQSFVWEQYNNEGQVINTDQGNLITEGDFYVLDLNTEELTLGEYLIIITLDKDNYDYKVGLLFLTISERPTLINGSFTLGMIFDEIEVTTAKNYSYSYVDYLTSTSVTTLLNQSYSYTSTNQGDPSGQGTLFYNSSNGLYVLDLDTETKSNGTYTIIIVMGKENYTTQINTIVLNIIKKEFSSEYFPTDQIIRIASGIALQIQVTLIDLNSVPIVGANVYLIIKNVRYNFTDNGDGTYSIRIPNIANTFFSPQTLVVQGYIEKANFRTETFSRTIVVEMEEILPGLPTFYFLLVLSAIIAFSASVAAYKGYKYITIPEFVKKARAMKKAIEKEKSISESLLYQNKEVFIGERVKHKWDKIGLSLGEILGIKIEKETLKRRISKDVKIREFKPSGLLLMKWDDRIGTELLTKYPEDLWVTDKTLMQIYGTHEYSGERGIINLTVENSTILSYYTGSEQSIYLLLFLNIDDDPDVYEMGMSDIIQIILENYEDESYLQMIPSLFQRLSVYPSLSDEEILALDYENEIKRMIINMLRDNGVITKSELLFWLKDKYTEGFMDVEAILLDFITRDIIKQVSVKGLPSDLIVLINDLFMLRVPPVKLLENPVDRGLPTQFAKTYPSDVKKFFQNYRPTQEDNLKILKAFINPQVYETLRLLRIAIVTRQDLEKLRKKGVDDIDTVLNLLRNNKMITIFQDQNKIEYYALVSDFYLDIIFPKYILKAVKTAYEQKSKANKVLINYLTALEDTYFDLQKREKSKE